MPRSCYLTAMLCSAGAVCGVISGCGDASFHDFYVETPAPTESFAGPTMGTSYSVRYTGADLDLGEAELQALADSRLAEINRRMSTYDAESELSRFNRHASGEWFDVSRETALVVRDALELAEESGGAFDPTVGPVVNLWGFGPDGRRVEPPSDDAIVAALARVGWRKVEVRLDPPALRKSIEDLKLDLSAIAKGYASDEIAKLLADKGALGCMVEIGGEVATVGSKPDGSAWLIGIQALDGSPGKLHRVLKLRGEALATSGDYRNRFESDGVRYSHTIDPTTGRPVRHNLAAVSVLAENCMKADALATTLLVMGRQRGYDWAEERGLAALFLERSADGPIEYTTPAWESAQAAE